MCASCGLGDGLRGAPLPDYVPPLDERIAAAEIARSARTQDSNAKIMGKRARNLDPVVVAAPTCSCSRCTQHAFTCVESKLSPLPGIARAPSAPAQRRRWQRGQKCELRFMKFSL